jgi:hypothetical protein
VEQNEEHNNPLALSSAEPLPKVEDLALSSLPKVVSEAVVEEDLAPHPLLEKVEQNCLDDLAPPFPKVEEETYKKCTGPDGKKYIRSKQTNIVYNLDIYIAKEELVPVGKWVNNMVVFNYDDDSDSELEEE